MGLGSFSSGHYGRSWPRASGPFDTDRGTGCRSSSGSRFDNGWSWSQYLHWGADFEPLRQPHAISSALVWSRWQFQSNHFRRNLKAGWAGAGTWRPVRINEDLDLVRQQTGVYTE